MAGNTTAKDIGTGDTGALREAVLAFLDDFSIETTPHTARNIDEYPEYLPRGTTVYVAHPPNTSLDEVVALALRLAALGYHPVPHIAARRIESQTQLAGALEALQNARIGQALVIGGDLTAPAGPFDSTMRILETGLLPQHGFQTVGIAGHPEGSRAVGPTKLRRALHEKMQFGAETGLRMYIVTQFGFNPAALIDWEAATARDGIDLPLHVGMAGWAPLKELLRYALRCGISASMRMLVSQASAMAEQIKLTPMDELVLAFSRHRATHAESRITRAHFFAFGGLERTARWLGAVREGRFEIGRNGQSIRVTG